MLGKCKIRDFCMFNFKDMIGIGTDIVSVKRFKGIEKKRAMLEKIFTEKEIAYALSKAVSAETFAGHFAAKEAIIKAFTSFGKKLGFKDVEITHLKNKQPIAFIKNFKGYTILLSIAHETDYAVSSALVTDTQI